MLTNFGKDNILVNGRFSMEDEPDNGFGSPKLSKKPNLNAMPDESID